MTTGPPPTSAAGSADRALLTAAVLLGGAGLLAVLLGLTALGSPAVWAIGAVAGGAVAVALAAPSPLARLVGVLLLQVTQLGGEAGLSAIEVVAGLALVGYLAHWYALALASGRPVVRTLFDVAAVAWGTVGFAAAVGLGLMFGPDAYDFRADVLATIPFLFYLPVKELCAEDGRAGFAIGAVLCVFGVFATVQNALLFRNAVVGADALYEIADARFNVGETSITAGLMIALAQAALATRRLHAVGWVAVAGVLLAGLLVTKSRGFWIAAALGILAMAVVAPGRGRRRIVGYGALGAVAVVAVAFLLFRDQLSLVALGVLDRLVSIGGASTDISLVNRFAESAGVWKMIRVNPILGYGWGVQATHYSIIAQGTSHWAFFHNGYLALWFKTGLWGLALMMAVWTGAAVRAAWATRRRGLPPRLRALALGAGATIAAFTPVVASSNPFSVLDQMLVVTLVMALAHGTADRAHALLGR
ncbi:O-antigen ligase family protein [Rubrivirga sp.]|uniref:O-antigen ligase family protein n=1 Tax=Rubrivirga sp. TaxID=1885344 RepID=UPI003B5222B0